MLVRRLVAVLCALTAALAVGVVGAPSATGIARGFTASPGQFPWAVQLRFDDIRRADGTVYDSACSGVLVSRTWIMTAGHCFHDGNRNRVGGVPRYRTWVRLGTVSTTDPAAGIRRTVTWVAQSPKNDIALARLGRPVDRVAPVALRPWAPRVGEVYSIAGWGATRSGGSWSDRLHWGQVRASTIGTVNAHVRGYRPYLDTSACSYDSGAPYVTTAKPPRLVSIESRGPACPHRSQETTARVDVVVGWVRATVRDLP